MSTSDQQRANISTGQYWSSNGLIIRALRRMRTISRIETYALKNFNSKSKYFDLKDSRKVLNIRGFQEENFCKKT